MKATTRTLVEDVVLAIGPDIEYVRPEGQRVYLTGVEIGFVIAVGLAARFLDGYLDGLVKKPGEELGERHRGLVAQGLRKVGDSLLRRHADETDAAVAVAEEAGEQLELLLPQVCRIAEASGGIEVPAGRASGQQAVERELVRLGFPADVAGRHARNVAAQFDQARIDDIVAESGRNA